MLPKKTVKNKKNNKGKGQPDINEKLDRIINLLNEISQKLPNKMMPGEVTQSF